ncbi:hypothetical protein [Bradyrhizobium sp. ORS 86]|uniref:hypothetical protein n=1 Tax=Bradyrhizobium sp. ORS 86 TaxID=1685970 RepID=UPI00388D9E18
MASTTEKRSGLTLTEEPQRARYDRSDLINDRRDQGHDFGGEARFCARAVLVEPDERAIDEDVFETRILAQRLESPLPDP